MAAPVSKSTVAAKGPAPAAAPVAKPAATTAAAAPAPKPADAKTAAAADPVRRSRALGGATSGPGAAASAAGAGTGSGGMDGGLLSAMEDILEKLKILDYETKFCVERDLRPISRVYFALSSKSSEQWAYFSSLCAWLLKELNADYIPWQDEEAPNLVAQTVLDVTHKLGLADQLSAGKVALGWGDGACAVLNFLLDKLLAAKKWKVVPPTYAAAAAQKEDENAAVEDQNDAKEETDMVEEDDHVAGADDADTATDGKDEKDQKEIMHEPLVSNINPVEWKLELERVGPRLKFKSSASASKEWRTHLEQSVKHDKAMTEAFPDTKSQLAKIGAALRKAVDRISAKEKHIQKEFDHLGSDFREKQKRLDTLQEESNAVNKLVQELNNDLQSQVDAYENVKHELAGKSNSMGDLTPLRKLQNALADLKKEVAAMELRIGIVGQTLLQAKLKASHANAAGAPKHASTAADDDDD